MFMKKIINSIIFLIACIYFVACSNPLDDNFGLSGDLDQFSVIYTAQGVSDSSKRVLSVPMTAIDTNFSVYATLGGIKKASEDIKITFRIAPELVDKYNEENATNLPLMYSESYSIDKYEVTIKKGQLISDGLKINIDASKFDGIGTFLLPIYLEKVSPEMKINDDLRTAYLLFNGYYESNPFEMKDRTNWSAVGCSSDEDEAFNNYIDGSKEKISFPDNGRAKSIIDDEVLTFWGTAWRNNIKPGPPHWITIDMGEEQDIHGIKITGRAAKMSYKEYEVKSNGNPRIFYLEVSNDNINWENAGEFSCTNVFDNMFYLDHSKKARYFKITVTATQADFYGTHIAEVYAF